MAEYKEYKFYGKYKNVRNAAWDVFVDLNITSLPVKVSQIAKQMDIVVLSYSSGTEIIDNWNLSAVAENNDGFTALIDEKWYIFYNENIRPRARIRFTIAHELGHYLLGHELKSTPSGCSIVSFTDENIIKKRKTPVESEADMFAMRLLAPACVLWGLDITEAEDIMNLCNICLREAKERAQRMKILYERGKFLSDSKEKRVYEQFKEFIETEKENY